VEPIPQVGAGVLNDEDLIIGAINHPGAGGRGGGRGWRRLLWGRAEEVRAGDGKDKSAYERQGARVWQ
jgi:hypothetical protein